MYFLTRELISQPQNPQILKIQKLSKNQVQKVDVLCYVVFISLVGINAVWIVWPITRHKLSCLDFHFFETDLGFSFFLKRTLDFEKLFFYITNQQCIQNVQLDIHLHLLKVFQLTHATVNSTVDPVSSNHIVDTDSENLFCLDFRMLDVWSVNDCFEFHYVCILVEGIPQMFSAIDVTDIVCVDCCVPSSLKTWWWR